MLQIYFKIDSSFVNFSARDTFHFAKLIDQIFWFTLVYNICEATREMNTKITLEWAQQQFFTRIHTLFYLLHDITNPWITITTTIFTHRSRASLAQFSFCWWRHNQLLTRQWPDNCDAITWIMISNSLDITFIHDNIHGRSCKKIHIMRQQNYL